MSPRRRFISHLTATGRTTGPGFAVRSRARHNIIAETGSLSCGLPVRLRLLPTPPRGDAVTLGYMQCDTHMTRTPTLLTKRPHGRTIATRALRARNDDFGAAPIID